MENQVRKICCLKDTLLWKVFIVLSITLYLAKFAAFFPTDWFHQGKGTKKWKGNMFSVYSSGGLIKEKKYTELSEHYCSEQSKYEYTYNPFQITYYDAGGLCSRFGALSSGISAFLAFSVISFLLFICLTLLFKFGKTKSFKLHCSIFLNIFQALSEFACLVCIGASSKFTLYGDCNYLSHYTTSSTYNFNTCLDTGGVFSFFVSLLIMMLSITMVVFIGLYFCSKEVVEEPVQEAEIVRPGFNSVSIPESSPYPDPFQETRKPAEIFVNVGDDQPLENVD